MLGAALLLVQLAWIEDVLLATTLAWLPERAAPGWPGWSVPPLAPSPARSPSWVSFALVSAAALFFGPALSTRSILPGAAFLSLALASGTPARPALIPVLGAIVLADLRVRGLAQDRHHRCLAALTGARCIRVDPFISCTAGNEPVLWTARHRAVRAGRPHQHGGQAAAVDRGGRGLGAARPPLGALRGIPPPSPA